MAKTLNNIIPRATANPFAAFLKLAGRPVLVVGGGSLAEARLEKLLPAQADVVVVAPETSIRLALLAQAGQLRWLRRRFRHSDVRGKWVVFAATGKREVDRAVFAACDRRGVLCNAMDDPDYCHFYVPAIVQRGELQIAVSSNGRSPALAQQIRRDLEKQFDGSWALRVEELGDARRQILARVPPGEARRRLLHELAAEVMAKDGRAERKTDADEVAI